MTEIKPINRLKNLRDLLEYDSLLSTLFEDNEEDKVLEAYNSIENDLFRQAITEFENALYEGKEMSKEMSGYLGGFAMKVNEMIDKGGKEKQFRWACENGHLEVAKWLIETFEGIDIHAVNEYAFRGACENGHLEVERWLIETFDEGIDELLSS